MKKIYFFSFLVLLLSLALFFLPLSFEKFAFETYLTCDGETFSVSSNEILPYFFNSKLEGITFKTKMSLDSLTKFYFAKEKHREVVEGVSIVYYLSPFLEKMNLGFNLQVAVKNDYLLVGYPIIFKDF